jgi:hypothetical protein
MGRVGARRGRGLLMAQRIGACEFLRIVNERVDRSRVDDLAREIQRLTDERTRIAARLADARMRKTGSTEQLRLFTEARTLQLEARQDELRSELAGAQPRMRRQRPLSIAFLHSLAKDGQREPN